MGATTPIHGTHNTGAFGFGTFYAPAWVFVCFEFESGQALFCLFCAAVQNPKIVDFYFWTC
jgi:hypothetical protein